MRLIATVAALALAGCAGSGSGPSGGVAEPAGAVVPEGVDNSCGGRRYGSLVGKNAEVLETVLILGPVQVIRPGAVSSQTYVPDRINFIVGTDGRIARITCG